MRRLLTPTNLNLSRRRMRWKPSEGKSNLWKQRPFQEVITSLQKTPGAEAHAAAAEVEAAEEEQDALPPESPPPPPRTPTQEEEPAEDATLPQTTHKRRRAVARTGDQQGEVEAPQRRSATKLFNYEGNQRRLRILSRSLLIYPSQRAPRP